MKRRDKTFLFFLSSFLVFLCLGTLKENRMMIISSLIAMVGILNNMFHSED